MSISDYKQTIFVLKAPTGMVYNEIQAAYIDLGIMGYFCIKCLPNTIILTILFCTCVCMWEHTIRLTQSGNTNKINDGWTSKLTRKQQHLILYFDYHRYVI